MRPAPISAGCKDDSQYTETLNPLDPNQASNDSRYHSYRTDLQWNNTVHLSDLMNAPMLSATDLTFGYEHTADNINVKVIVVLRLSVHTGRRAAMTDDATYAGLQSTLWQRLTLTGQVRQDWVDEQLAVHLASWRGGGRAGDRHALQGSLRHRVPRTLAVRPLWRGFVRLYWQSKSEAGKRAGLGGRLHHHARCIRAE